MEVEALGSHGLGNLAHYPPVVPGRGVLDLQDPAQGLYTTLHIGEGALLLCKCDRGQDNVGHLGQAGQKGILDHQKLQPLSSLDHIPQFAVGEAGAVAHNHHGPYATR